MQYGGPRAIKEGQLGLNRSYSVAKSNNEPDSSAPHQTKNTPPSPPVYSATAADTFLIDLYSKCFTHYHNVRLICFTSDIRSGLHLYL